MYYTKQDTPDGATELLIEAKIPFTELFVKFSRKSGKIIEVRGIDGVVEFRFMPSFKKGARIGRGPFGMPLSIKEQENLWNKKKTAIQAFSKIKAGLKTFYLSICPLNGAKWLPNPLYALPITCVKALRVIFNRIEPAYHAIIRGKGRCRT